MGKCSNILTHKAFSDKYQWMYKGAVKVIEKHGNSNLMLMLDYYKDIPKDKWMKVNIELVGMDSFYHSDKNLEFWCFILMQEFFKEEFESILVENCNGTNILSCHIVNEIREYEKSEKDIFNKIYGITTYLDQNYPNEPITTTIQAFKSKIDTHISKIKKVA